MSEQTQYLEEQIAHHDMTIESLSETLAKQQQQIRVLQKELQLLTELIKTWREQPSDAESVFAVSHEIPPHY